MFKISCIVLVAFSLAPSLGQGAVLAYSTTQVMLTTPTGRQLRATIRRPESKVMRGQLGALLLFGGFEEAAKVLDLVQPSVPIILASFDYPFEPPRKFEFPGSLKFAPQAKRAVAEMIDGIVVLAAHLATRGDVDASQITIVGASFGAPFALAAAAREARLKNIVLIHGFADIPGTVQYRLNKVWNSKFGFLSRPAAWLLTRLGWAYLDAPAPEVSVAALSASQRVLMISADDDTIIPRASIEALWIALQKSQASHQRIRMPGDHLQPGAGKLIKAMMGMVTRWLKMDR